MIFGGSEEALHQNDDDEQGENIAKIGTQPAGELGAFSGIGLREVIFEAPAPAADAEQQIDDCADGQQQIADKEILAILHTACADELQVAPDMQGMLSTSMAMQPIREAFLRLMPKVSTAKARRFSNTASTVEKLAKVINRKNSVPHRRPPSILTKTLGSVWKMREGPASGWTP